MKLTLSNTTVASATLDSATKAKLILEAVKEVKAAVGSRVAGMLKNFNLHPLNGKDAYLQELTFTYDPKNLDALVKELEQFCNYEVLPIVIDGKDWYLGDGDDLLAVSLGTKKDDTPFANAPKGVGKIWLRQFDYDKDEKSWFSPRKAHASALIQTEAAMKIVMTKPVAVAAAAKKNGVIKAASTAAGPGTDNGPPSKYVPNILKQLQKLLDKGLPKEYGTGSEAWYNFWADMGGEFPYNERASKQVEKLLMADPKYKELRAGIKKKYKQDIEKELFDGSAHAKAAATTAGEAEDYALEAAMLTELFKPAKPFTKEEIEGAYEDTGKLSNARWKELVRCYKMLFKGSKGLYDELDSLARLAQGCLMALGIMKPARVGGVDLNIPSIKALYNKNAPIANRLRQELKKGKVKASTTAAGELHKTLQLLKTLNASQFGAEWDKEANIVRIWAQGAKRAMQLRIIGQLDKSIKEDTGAKSVMVMPGTSYKPNALTLNGKLENKNE